MLGKVCCPSAFTLTKLIIQAPSFQHAQTSIDQYGEQSINRDAETAAQISNVKKYVEKRHFKIVNSIYFPLIYLIENNYFHRLANSKIN